MSLGKGLAILGGIIGAGAVLASAPVLTISAPLWGLFGSTYTINGLAAAGVAASTAAGAGLGKLAGETGGALVIQGMDESSKRLMSMLQSVSN